jgi:hypothetical protein
MGVDGQRHAPATLPPGRDLVPIVQEAGWAPWLVGQARKISLSLGFDSWTVQPVASRYTDCAIPAHQGGSWKDLNLVGLLKGLVCQSSDRG